MTVSRPIVYDYELNVLRESTVDYGGGSSGSSGSGGLPLMAEFSLENGNLVVKHYSFMAPSLVDGNFMVEFESL